MAIKDVDCICSLSFILSPSNFKVIVQPSKSPHYTSSMHAELSTNTSARKLPSSQPSRQYTSRPRTITILPIFCSHTRIGFYKMRRHGKSISSSVSPGRAFKYKKPFSIFSRSVRHPQGVQNSPHIPGYATLMKRLAVFRTSSYFDVAAAREIGIQFHGNAGIIHRK